MSDKKKQKKSSNEQVEIPIPEDEVSSSKKSTFKRRTMSSLNHFFGHSSRSETSLGEADNSELEKFKIIEVKVEGYRTLLFINEEDFNLYEKMNQWVKDNPNETLESTVSKHDPLKHRNSDAIAKAVYDYPSPYLPDFIIRYENKKDEEKEKENNVIRRNFELLLLRTGLILERELDPEGKYVYVKIIAPFEILCEQAQQIRLKMRINMKENTHVELSKLEKISELYKRSCSRIYDLFSREINLKKESSFFKRDKLRKFEGAESDKNNAVVALGFFSTSRRNLLVHRIIITANQINRKVFLKNQSVTVDVKRKIESLALDKLLSKGVFDKFYPLHDGSPKLKAPKDKKDSRVELAKNNLRADLSKSWVKSFGSQPLGEIRTYFGEKLALYFAWLGFYTSWLTVASITGVIVIIYGLIDWSSKGRPGTVDDNGGISIIWDNALTAPYALLMSVWATCFLETWKRVNASIQYDWDVADFEKEELPRPQFYGTMLRISPITLKREIYFPSKEKIIKIAISGVIVIISIGIVIVTVGVLIKVPRKYFQDLGYVAPVVTGLVNLATIIILNMVYKNVARFLTNFENPRTETQFEDSLILKAYLFDFVNFYSVLIYMVLAGNQACRDACKTNNVACIDKCNRDQGMVQITIQLAIIFVGKQLIGQIQEILIPWVLSRRNKAKSLTERNDLKDKYINSGRKKVPRWVRDDHLASSSDTIKTEYEEMVIQFGFLALFGVAFPLAPLFAWLNNVFEIRSDAFKYIKTLQRPVGFQTQDLGMWESIMRIVSFIAVLTNSIIIAFRSLWMENQFKNAIKYYNHYNGEDREISDYELLAVRLIFVIAFEHFVFIIKLMFAHLIPDIPNKVKISMEREQYLTRLALEEEAPALDEYYSGDEDDASLFSVGGSLLLPRPSNTDNNIDNEKTESKESKEQ